MTSDQEYAIELGNQFEAYIASIVGVEVRKWFEYQRTRHTKILRYPPGDTALDKNEARDMATGALTLIDDYLSMLELKLTEREIALDEAKELS